MPDWSSTSITIEGPKAEIESIHRKIKEWTRGNYFENDFGKDWLGSIVVGPAGFSDNRLAYRGLMTSMDEEITARQDEPDTYYFQVQYDSVWTDVIKTWKIVLKKFAPNCKMYYVVEELGCEYYVKNDRNGKYYGDEIIILSHLEKTNPLYQKWKTEFGGIYMTRQFLKESLTNIFGRMPLRKLIKKAKAIPRTDNENEYVCIYEVQYV